MPTATLSKTYWYSCWQESDILPSTQKDSVINLSFSHKVNDELSSDGKCDSHFLNSPEVTMDPTNPEGPGGIGGCSRLPAWCSCYVQDVTIVMQK